MPKQPFFSIPLDIADVRVLQTDLTQAGELILTVESTLDSTRCHRCGRTITDLHGTDKSRLLRHLPVLGHPLYLRIHPKRFRCPFCDDHPTTTQVLDWYDPQALHTKAYERHLIVLLVNSTLSDVVAKEDVTYDALLGLLDRWIAKTVDWTTLPAFTTLGIDEIALTKGHRNFVAVLTGRSDAGTLHLLAVLPDRLKATVVTWLRSMPEERRQAITTACTDMWEGYVTAVEEVLPHATIVIDRFHVACHYRSAVDDLRKQEVRRLRHELPEAEREHLKRTLWPFRKCPKDLSEAEQARLDILLQYSPALEQAYTLREELTAIFDTARSKADGLRRLRFWRQRVERSGLECFQGFLKLLDTWQDRIANYFTHHESSGFVEGLNNKLKVLKRRCYGIRNVGRLFQRLTLDLEGYRRFSPWFVAAH
jgi:transposase